MDYSLIEILKEKYEYENERKRYYDNVITLPITLLAFVVAGIYVIVVDDTIRESWYNNLIPWLIIVIIIGTVTCMYFLFRVFFGFKRKYGSFPDSETVLNDYRALEEYHKTVSPTANIKELVENDFININLVKWYSDINNPNIRVNDIRADNYHYLKISIGLTYLIGILVFGLFSFVKLNQHKVAKSNQQQTQNTPPPSQPKPQPSPVRQEKSNTKKPPLK